MWPDTWPDTWHDTCGLNTCGLTRGLTRGQVAELIATHGFDERVASLSGLYGAGVYFANQACKAAQYAERDRRGHKTIIVARVTLGDPYYAASTDHSLRRPPDRNAAFSKGATFDSVVANGEHRELIVYDHRQACPEIILRVKE